MMTAFTWELRSGAERRVRFVLIDNVAIAVESTISYVQPEVRSWIFDTAEQARTKALRLTQFYDGQNFTLSGDILTAEVDVHMPGLTAECGIIAGGGPILQAIVATLLSPLGTAIA